MAISVSKNKNTQPKKKDVETLLEEQRLEIEQLKKDKVDLQVLTAEMYEQSQADKLEMQTAMAELAEALLMSVSSSLE